MTTAEMTEPQTFPTIISAQQQQSAPAAPVRPHQQFARQQFQLLGAVSAGNLERTYYTPTNQLPQPGDVAVLIDAVTAANDTILTLAKVDATRPDGIVWVADFWQDEVIPAGSESSESGSNVDASNVPAAKALVDVEWLASIQQLVRGPDLPATAAKEE